MCGIGAIWGKSTGKQQTLKDMLSTIASRGNSLYEMREVGNCCLGANRLEIVDRSNGKQPKMNEDGTLFAVFNGEVFNHKQLKIELKGKGHVYSSDCDTETLVHLYEEYGEGMMDKLDSEMFAFVIYDSKHDTLFAARDRFGVKPLYWASDEDGTIYLGSEIKALSCLEKVKEIHFFPPGHYLKNGKLEKYYVPGLPSKRKLGVDAAAKLLRELMDEAVKKRVDTDLPIGVFFSGGLDSTSILATARKFHKNIVAIIVGKQDSEDVKFATRYCRENGVKFTVHSPPAEEQLFSDIEKTISICESFEPNVVRQSALSYYISKIAHELDFRIVLCGEGADELFFGYPEFKELGKNAVVERQNAFLKDLHRTQFQRVDRTSMHFTVEVRAPFFDQKVVEFARSMPVELMLTEENGEKKEKYLLRKAMEDRLPPYICWRKKVVLSEGAGYKGNQPGGLFESFAMEKVGDEEFVSMQKAFPEWHIHTKEEAFYFSIFYRLGFAKAHFNSERVTANHSSSLEKRPLALEEQLFEVISSHRYCRFKPKKSEDIMVLLKQAVAKKKPIELWMLWGVWKKSTVNGAESEALEIFEAMHQEVKKIYPPGIRLTLVMADTHAAVNLMDKMSIYGYDSYLGSFERFANSKGHNVVRLSEVLSQKNSEVPNMQGELVKIQSSSYWPILISSAKKYFEGKDTEEGVRAYVRRRLSEKPFLEKAFKNSIFLTYNGPRYDALAPDVPTLYPISNRKRTNEKPWFNML
jgi:asparagine synthase (glutamine-hydrolysing)